MNEKVELFSKWNDQSLTGAYLRRTVFLIALSTLLFLLNLQNTYAQNAKVPFNFSLSQASKTSAGVYKRNGNVLVRTLWNNVSYPAGTHTAYWDRVNDDGNMLTDTGYYIKVISNNVAYNWEGVVGNNSDSISGTSKIRAFDRFHSLTFAGQYGYYAVGYTEGVPSCYKFDISKPNSKINILWGPYKDIDLQCDYVSTDGSNVYWAGYDPYNANLSMVFTTKTSDDKEFIHSSGTSQATTYGRTYASAIDLYTTNPNAHPSGLAVQISGDFLFVAHRALNQINVLNKTTGAQVQTLSFTAPREICVDPAGNLWVISGTNTIEKFAVNSNGTLGSTLLSITGITEPLAMAVSPNGSKLFILDGAASQQVKIFDNATGSSISTFGSAGGYINNASVNDYKFYFSDSVTELSKPFIAFQTDSSFWLGDVGNERVQHYNASGTFLNRIMCLPHSYSTVVDRNNPNRVFNEFLEFNVDYSKPLGPHNGSWTLVNNWRRGIKANYFQNDKLRIFIQLITLSNNRTYALLDEYVNGIRKPEVVELINNGNIRYTGIKLQDFAHDIIGQDGSLRRIICSRNIGDSGYWQVQTLNRFDGNNNPIWNSSQKIAWIPSITANDPAFSNIMAPAVTSGGYNIIFNAEKDNKGYHLGAIKTGTNQYIWKTSKATKSTYTGPMPKDGAFDIGNNVVYPGGDVYTMEKNIFWNHHGEFWKNSQTNIWNHYHESGLMVSQFGVVSPEAEALEHEAFAKGAGNVFSSTLVKVGSDYYIYHNDESVHGGVHRWKISGLNSITEQNLSISMQTVTGTGLIGNYYDGVELNNFKMKASVLNSTVNLSTPPSQVTSASNFSTKWTGFIKPAYSQAYTFYTNTSKGVKLWINNVLVIDKWSNASLFENSSPAINLSAGVLYAVRMEISGGTATLSWQSASQSKQVIPSNALFPGAITSYDNGYNLMEGIEYTKVLTDALYGWNRNATNNSYINDQMYWTINCNNKTHIGENPDISIRFRNTSNYNVTRDIGVPNACITAWKISGNMNLEFNYPNIDNGEYSYFDILDPQGKIISRVTHEMYYSGNDKINQIKLNGKALFTRNEKYLYDHLNNHQAFEVSANAGVLTFGFADYTKISAGIFDKSADWTKPKTIRFSYLGNSYDRAIDLSQLVYAPVVTPAPVISANGNIVFCQGDSVRLSSSNANAYLWSNNAMTNSIVVKNSGTYSVSTSNQYGCVSTSNSIVVNVNTLPQPIIKEGQNISICQGDTAKLSTINASAYLWSNNVTAQAIDVTKAGTFTVKVTDNNGCQGTTAPTTVTVNQLPNATITADGATSFCQGKHITLSAPDAAAYLWNNGLSTKNIIVVQSGDYSVTITDNNACKNTSNTINVSVSPFPKPVVTYDRSKEFCQGDSVTLSADQANEYLWNTGEKTKSITVKATGVYTVAAGDGNGCAAVSDPQIITVNQLPTPVISANNNLLNSNYTSGNQWYLNGNIIQGATQQSLSVSESGLYSVKVSDEKTCEGYSAAYEYLVSNTGINAIKNEGILIAPNPNKGNFKIIHSSARISIEIVNLLGENIYSNSDSDGNIDMSFVAKGMYIVKVKTIDKVHIERIIVE